MTEPKHTERSIQQILYFRHAGSSLCILPNFTPRRWYEADLFVVMKSKFTVEYEIKVTRSDYRADFKKNSKHHYLAKVDSIMNVPTRFFYAMPKGLIPESEIPEYAGLIYVSWSGATIVRQAPRLSSRKFSMRDVYRMRRTADYRFWAERHRFNEYKILAEQARELEGRA